MRQYILPIFTFIIFLLLWQFFVIWLHIEQWIIPSPLRIINSFWQSRSLMFYHTIPTVFEALIGLFCATILGIFMAILMERSEVIRKIIYPFLIISQTVPFITLAPLLTLWFGFGLLPKIIIIILVCFFPITINLFDGLNGVDSATIKLLISMGATRGQILKWVKWPFSLPAFFSGLKIAGAYAILGAVISEWVGSDRGLGILLTRSAKSYLVDRVFATIGVITILSIIIILVIEGVARITIPWNYKLKIKKI
jgi:ABC-type nitrate/sulfonate/bicarbonate transport system permease component